jgi:hypothetical protein
VTRATAAGTYSATAATTADTHATANGMAATAARMAATATTRMATTAFRLGRVGRGRQRGRKNNDGNPDFERRHNLLRSVWTFVARIPLTFMILAGQGQFALMQINYVGHRTFFLFDSLTRIE